IQERIFANALLGASEVFMSNFRLVIGVFCVLAAAACARADERTPSASHSQTLVASSDGRTPFVVSPDDRTVLPHHIERGTTSAIEVGTLPTRIARLGDRLFVSLRGERSVAVIGARAGAPLAVETKIAVGAEPFGVVAHEATRRIYVASSAADEVVEID